MKAARALASAGCAPKGWHHWDHKLEHDHVVQVGCATRPPPLECNRECQPSAASSCLDTSARGVCICFGLAQGETASCSFLWFDPLRGLRTSGGHGEVHKELGERVEQVGCCRCPMQFPCSSTEECSSCKAHACSTACIWRGMWRCIARSSAAMASSCCQLGKGWEAPTVLAREWWPIRPATLAEEVLLAAVVASRQYSFDLGALVHNLCFHRASAFVVTSWASFLRGCMHVGGVAPRYVWAFGAHMSVVGLA
eukprot:5999052-Amphidinium_carterae.3